LAQFASKLYRIFIKYSSYFEIAVVARRGLDLPDEAISLKALGLLRPFWLAMTMTLKGRKYLLRPINFQLSARRDLHPR